MAKNWGKIDEYRVVNEYWKKRLLNREYDEIHYYDGYPPKTEKTRVIKFKFSGVDVKTIVHEQFGPEPVVVYAISLRERI